jgi:hypothetical protein
MLNKLNGIMVVLSFLSLSACDGPVVIEEDATDDGGTDDTPVDVQEEAETFTPICSDPFSCTPERACDITPVLLSFTDVDVPFSIEGSFSSPAVTYGVEDDAFFSISWPTADNKVEWQHIEEGNHTFFISYGCEESLWTATAQLDDGAEEVITFAASCSADIEAFDFNPSILAAPEVEFGPICTTTPAE